jgi:multicomponent Na+:H+ antiporter subunit D
MVNLGVVAIARLTLDVYGPPARHTVLGLLTAIGIVSAVLGALLALAQDDLKRLLAWDTVSQMGILTVGFASAEAKGVAGAVYHLVNHGLFKALLFLCAGSIVHATGQTQLSQMGGLARRRPLTTAAFTIGALAIAGVPPMNGYASLGLIHEGVERHHVVFALALVAQAITVAALGRATHLAFYRRRAEPYEHIEPPRAGMRVSLLVLGTGCIAFGIVASAIVNRVAAPAASILLHPSSYASAVIDNQASAVPPMTLDFAYLRPTALLEVAAELVCGLALAMAYVRAREPRPVTWLRSLHTGSVNDYAGFAAGGLVIAAVALLG